MRFCLAACCMVLSPLSLAAQPPVDLSQIGLPAGMLAPEAKVTSAVGVAFLEGCVADAQDNIFFSDIAGNRILKLSSGGQLSVFRPDSGRTNGNTFDAQGRLISCEGNEQGPGRRRIVRTDLRSGQVEVLTDRYEGKRYNSPNDVVVDPQGRIWFTDPYYGPDRSVVELPEAVYRIDTAGKVARMLGPSEVGRPNGLAITPDGKTLYVVDSHYVAGGNHCIWAFDLSGDGTPSGRRKVFDFGLGRGGDGMRLDVQGNLWVTAGILNPRHEFETADVPPGVYVITPQGKLLGRIPIPEDVITNLCFAGADRKTLYVTAGKTLYKVPVAVSGYALYPPVK